MCAGKDFATQALFINIATILWGADIEAPLDSNGTPILPSLHEVNDKGVIT